MYAAVPSLGSSFIKKKNLKTVGLAANDQALMKLAFQYVRIGCYMLYFMQLLHVIVKLFAFYNIDMEWTFCHVDAVRSVNSLFLSLFII